MGFRRSLVRIQSPRLVKPCRDSSSDKAFSYFRPALGQTAALQRNPEIGYFGQARRPLICTITWRGTLLRVISLLRKRTCVRRAPRQVVGGELGLASNSAPPASGSERRCKMYHLAPNPELRQEHPA